MTNKPRNIIVTDCTLRDGSYVNGYKLDQKDVADIVRCIDSANIDRVEVGHGLGIGAHRVTKAAKCTDLEYCIAAKQAVCNSDWGVFGISGIMQRSDMEPILELKPSFLKVGIEPGNFDALVSDITLIRNFGVRPILFMMKSYAWSDAQFEYVANIAQEHDCEEIVVVDSAGTMLPNEVSEVIEFFLNLNEEFVMGFHGHNNLGMAVSNSIACLKTGGVAIDASLLGIGRSAGNCVLEQLLIILHRMGLSDKYNVLKLLEFSELFISSIFVPNRLIATDVAMGAYGFHSGFLNVLEGNMGLRGLPVSAAIYEVSKKTKFKPTEEDINMIAQVLKGE